jgi:hypothetical protein
VFVKGGGVVADPHQPPHLAPGPRYEQTRPRYEQTDQEHIHGVGDGLISLG